MIALLTAAVMVKAARTMPATSRRDRVALVARPNGVVHVAVAPLTRTGRSLPPKARPVCGTRSRRLAVLRRCSGGVDLGNRRPCSRCRTVLAARTGLPGLARPPHTRDEHLQAYAALTPSNLAAAARAASTVADADQVAHLLEVLYGSVRRRGRLDTHEAEVADLRRLVGSVRSHLVNRARTPEEVADLAAARAARDEDNQRRIAARRREESMARVAQLAAAGRHLLPWERAAIGT